MIGLGLALALSACSTPYEYREYEIFARNETWGKMYIGVRAQGSWNEKMVSVYGTPYGLTFAPRVVGRPALDCELSVSDLRISSDATRLTVFEAPRLVLDAGPPQPDEPNNQPYSPHFHFVPLEKAYLASGNLERVDLPFEPLRVTFNLQGSPTCPPVFRSPVRYDMVLEPWTQKGMSSLLPSV